MSVSDRELMTDPFAEGNAATYVEAIVTFVDILGFSAMVAKKTEEEVAAAILRLQQSAQPPHNAKRKLAQAAEPLGVHAFSDCVVRIRPAGDPDELGPTFVRELADLAAIQASLAGAGVFVRGGVTIDRVYTDARLVFGPGLIRAYKLEAEFAHVPRIVIDPAAIQRFRGRDVPKTRMHTEITAMRRSIRQSDDGLWFVDYLRAGAAALGDDRKVLAFLKDHRSRVIAAAVEVEVGSSVLPKYLWAARYHNATCLRILKKTSIPGVTIGKNQLPNFERLRHPLLSR